MELTQRNGCLVEKWEHGKDMKLKLVSTEGLLLVYWHLKQAKAAGRSRKWGGGGRGRSPLLTHTLCCLCWLKVLPRSPFQSLLPTNVL